ncbi:hypothetical protein [Alteribacter keqinensis]|uniref:Uncharacterized protein n=1 Tax=Alteribacter keqinensis TaxID=2483800 RepID=A0A3M7TYS6_9BACI|nr:hypothetical protein [Alteribacter keqinensis]RNA69944.1 hypothetical protein EBO34_08435 [Alteribacter keqinensis]
MREKQFLKVMQWDALSIWRDPFMIFVCLVPFIMVAIVKYALPAADDHLLTESTFQLSDHYHLIMTVIIAMIPLMIGMVAGFLFIDEKDEGILAYVAVTPFSKTGYLINRMLFPTLSGFMISLLCTWLLRMEQLSSWAPLVLSLLLSSLMSPLVMVYLVSFAKNKVEGMAYAKLLSIVMALPIIPYAVGHKIAVLAYIVPLTWLMEMIYMTVSGTSFGFISHWTVLCAGGAGVTFAWLYLLYVKASKDVF